MHIGNSSCLSDSLRVSPRQLILLMRSDGMVNPEKLRETLANTFSNRGTVLKLIEFEGAVLKAIQKLWIAHLRDIGDYAEELDLPKDIGTVIDEVNKYMTATL